MTLKKFLPKICTLRGLEARIADFGLKGPGFDPPTNQKNFFYTPFLTILHTVICELIKPPKKMKRSSPDSPVHVRPKPPKSMYC